MKKILFFLLAAISTWNLSAAHAEPVWWWDCKGDDVIVKGQISYGSSPHLTITHTAEGQQLTSYFILGTLKVEKWLYLTSEGRYVDDYRFLSRERPKEVPVLIQAARVNSLHERAGDPVVVAPWPYTIHPSSQLLVLNQNYVFPISHLTLESPIPPEKEKEALALIAKRKNNLLQLTVALQQRQGTAKKP